MDHVITSGYLNVGDGHQIYWEDWGNPSAQPIFHLHGGPGGGFNDSHKAIYDPAVHRVIFHDQRGCGKSRPFAEVAGNTTEHLVCDIELLREHLGIERCYLSGGSWGSTLALCYALAHPEQVAGMLLWSMFLARKFDVDYVHGGQGRHNFPETWERFIALVPPVKRASADDVLSRYWAGVNSPDQYVARQYAGEWTLWECSLVSLDYDPARLLEEILGDEDSLAIAKLEIEYFRNGCFIPENYILGSLQRIQHIPCQIVHGRFDMCCPPSAAYELAQAYGPNAALQWVNCGHLRTEPAMLAALQRAAVLLVD